jgi:hypothetical protein
MLLHIYFCDDWFWPKLKRISNAFENLICKTLEIKGKGNSFTFLSLSAFGPFGLLAHSVGLPPLPSPAGPRAPISWASPTGQPQW